MGKGDRKRRNKKKKKRKNISLNQKKKEETRALSNLKELRVEEGNKINQISNVEQNNSGPNTNKKDEKVVYEVLKENLTFDEKNPFHFLKWATKCKELDGTKIKDMDDREFRNNFPFADRCDKDKFKNLKNTEFPFAWFEGKNKDYHINKEKVEKLSGILKDNELVKFVSDLIPYSFILQAKIKLISPYFSKDDDNFYLIDNPLLKEKVFKVPMVRGSGWKGAIASGFRSIINGRKDKRELIQSYLRIFGTGSSEFRELEKMIDDYINKSKEMDFDKLISYLLFELGIRLEKDDIIQLKDKENRINWLKNNLWGKLNKGSNEKIPNFLKTHKGRAIFYPTYFNKLSFEVINPHDRKKRAGTNPIYYEVVPRGEKGILQIVYIPFDSVLKKKGDIEKEVEQDISNLINAIEKTKELGIGAKKKLGWGQFDITQKTYCLNGTVQNIETDWEKCKE